MTSPDTRNYVPVGEGRLHLPQYERTTGRFGCIALVQSGTADQMVEFADIPEGQHGWLVAEQVDGLQDGATWLLGQGTLRTTNRIHPWPVIYLAPDDCRDTDWMDGEVLVQQHGRETRLLWIADEAGE